MTEPNPESVRPWYLRNLNQALALDESTGNVYLRTGITGDVIVEGDVNVPGNVEISNDVGNAIPVSTELDPAVFINPEGKTAIRVDDDTVQHTSTNRRKVSSQELVFFNTFQYGKDSNIWDESISGNATSTFDEFQAGVIMEVSSSGDEVIRQTRNVMQYIPGRQNELVCSVKYDTPQAGIRRRVGIFNENNGAFFEDDGGTYSVVLRRNTSSGVIETRVSRDNWNVDPLDGTGPSGITADPTKQQMMTIEYEWYGAGIVEFKYIIENNAIPIHRFFTANYKDFVWSNTAFLPIRLELTNVGASGTHTLLQGSSTLLSEGNANKLGREENITTPLTGVEITDANTFYPVLSIRLRSDRIQGIVIPTTFQGATLDNTGIFYRILRNTTLTGADWENVSDESFCEYDYSATSYTGGDALQTGYISSTNQGIYISFPDNAILQLSRNNMGSEGQIFTLAIAAKNSNKDAFGSLSWIEVR